MRLEGKVALVTGASRGIGKAIAQRFASEGASVVFASRSEKVLAGIAAEIRAGGGKAHYTYVDVRNYDSVLKAVETAAAYFGRVDIMVNNAGIAMAQPSEELSPEDWTLALETDLSGVFFGCRSAGIQMMRQGGGCIINISSIYGIVAAPMRAAYCASKAAVNMLTKVLASEWAGKGIRVNAIAPGYIRTELVQGVIDKGMLPVGALEKRTPIGRIGEVEDLLGAAVYLAGDESLFVTGTVMTVDGGWTAYGYL